MGLLNSRETKSRAPAPRSGLRSTKRFNFYCAKRVIGRKVELKIYFGSFLELDTDLLVLPADPDLQFQQPQHTKVYRRHVASLLKLFKGTQSRVVKYSGLQETNQSSCKFCLFCQAPFYVGREQDSAEVVLALKQLFAVLELESRENHIDTVSIAPLQRRLHSFPAVVLAKAMIGALVTLVRDNIVDNPEFGLSIVNIICDSRPMAKAFSRTLVELNEDYESSFEDEEDENSQDSGESSYDG